jgi:YfiR/HmsC-like
VRNLLRSGTAGRRRRWLIGAALAAVCGVAAADPGAQTASAPALKAAFLFNFAKFTEWPWDVLRPGASLVLCVAGEPRVSKALEDATAGRDVEGHPLTTRSIDIDGPVQSCHILYIESFDDRRALALLERIKGKPVLTVSDLGTFAELGGVANLFVEDGRMRFAVNVESAQRSKLRLSSRLLSLAKIVKDAPNALKR